MPRILLILVLLMGCSESEPLLPDYVLEGDTLHPEGIAFDGPSRQFFFGSLSEGTLFALDAAGTQRVFAAPSADGTSTFGLAVDEARRVLWACAQPAEANAADAVRRYDIDTGDLLGTSELSTVAADAQCNDLIARDGVAYVSDPSAPRIYRVDADGTPSLFLENEVLAPTIPGLGANGITLSDDGETLFVAYFSPAQILALPVATPDAIAPLTLSGDALSGPSPLSGPDGLVMHRGELVAVFDDALFRIALEPNGSGAVRSVPLDGLSGLSTAAVAEGELYVSKSEVVARVLGNPPELPFRILRIDE